MTTQQKRFSQAQKEAKSLRKKNPKLTHQQALKQAFAIVYKKSPVKKSAKRSGTKKVGAVKTQSKSHTDKNRITANIQIGSIDKAIGSMEKKYLAIYTDKGAISEMVHLNASSLKEAKKRALFYKRMEKIKGAVSVKLMK